MEVDPWGLPYKLVTKRLVGRRPIEGIKIPGRLYIIVDTLFSTHQTPIWTNDVVAVAEVPTITREELQQVGDNLLLHKAPGQDGVLDVILKHVIKERPELLLGTLSKCLQEGHFPSTWKESRLVLLRKRSKPLDQPFSYRPICLKNTVGKLFERIIKNRLEVHLDQNRAISGKQFGFRKSRSTVDAIL